MQFVAVQIEIVLGAWLLLGRWRVGAWMSACLMLTALAALSVLSAVRGQSDCGCFGQLKVHPGITAAINLVALGLLVVFRPPNKWAENRGSVAVVVGLAVVAGEVTVELELTFRGTPGDFAYPFEFLTDDKTQPKL